MLKKPRSKFMKAVDRISERNKPQKFTNLVSSASIELGGSESENDSSNNSSIRIGQPEEINEHDDQEFEETKSIPELQHPKPEANDIMEVLS